MAITLFLFYATQIVGRYCLVFDIKTVADNFQKELSLVSLQVLSIFLNICDLGEL